MESLRGALVPGLPGQWRIGCHPLSRPPAHAKAGGRRHMNSRSVPAAASWSSADRGSGSTERCAPLGCRGRDLGAGGWPRQGTTPTLTWVRLGEIPVGGRSGREEPQFGGNIHCSYHLLLSFSSQLPSKTQFCFFPLLPFEEKPAAGCLLCSAKSSYEPFYKKIRVRRGILLKRDAF